VNWKIPLFDLDYGKEELEAVKRVIESRWISQGPETQSFEKAFADFIGLQYALATSSGTSALHLAYLALGVEARDEVIVPSFTFIATVSPLLWIGAIPVFSDIKSPEIPNIAVEMIEPLVTEKTKGVVFVHYAGFSRGVDEIRDFCSEKGLFLIEDASHAHGAVWKGKKAGTFGDIAVFSLFANKNLAVGEGGIIVTGSKDIYEKAKLLRSHGMTRLAWDKYESGEILYDVEALGYNYRLTELQAALGKVQLRKLNENNRKRRILVRRYRRLLKDVEGIVLPFFDEDVEGSSHYIFPLLLPDEDKRRKVVEFLKKEGIQTSVHYPAIHQFSLFSKGMVTFRSGGLKNTEEASRRELTLPLWPSMTETQVDEVVSNLKMALKITK